MPFAFSIASGPRPYETDPQFFDKLRTVNNNINLYGTAEEIKMINDLVNAFQNRDDEKIKVAHPALYNCVRTQLRKELGIGS